jgi:hypothetical protein
MTFLYPPALSLNRAGVAELADAAGLGPVEPKGSWRFESSRPHGEVLPPPETGTSAATPDCFRPRRKEGEMYIGGGVLVLIIVILLLIWLF